MKKAIILIAMCVLAAGIAVGGYSDMDEHGCRIFSKVPPPGVHPRVILSPEDLPEWRKEVIKTYRGSTFFSKRFKSPEVIDVLAELHPNISDEALLKGYPHTGPGHNHHLLYATLDVIYHEDEEKAKHVCKAIANFARVLIARNKLDPAWGKIEDKIGDIAGLKGIPTGLTQLWYRGGADFALAYDFLYNHMTKEQQDICRKAISLSTKDLVTWGMHFPRGRAVSNWYGYHGEMGPMLLAIEGEAGFRTDQWKAFKQMIRDWFDVQIYETGGGNEDGYIFNTGLREGQFTMIAMARRGENLFVQPHMNNYLKWVILSLVPGEAGGSTVGYTSNRAAPYESAPLLTRWAMPGNKLANYYLNRFKGEEYQFQKKWQYGCWSTMLCMNYEDTERCPLDIAELGLPITHVFPYQGLFITRSDWTDTAVYLNVLARQDAWYDRHENVDRGRFVFAANGRRWAIDYPWARGTKSQDHSLVHIDGIAQFETKGMRGKAPCARLIEYGDYDASGKKLPATERQPPGVCSFAVLDLSNAYNWTWAHSWGKPGEGWEAEPRSFEQLGWHWKRPGQPEKLHGHDNPSAPRYNFRGCNYWRKPYNPVKKAYRLAGLVRGHHPYAIISDDILKDGKTHKYAWYMHIPEDVEQQSVNGNDLVLREKGEKQQKGQPVKGSRRLLVRFISPSVVDINVSQYQMGVDRRSKQPYYGNRVSGSISAVEPGFKVMLLPYLVGEAFPKTALSEGSMTVEFADQKDTIAFTQSDNEPTRISVTQTLRERSTPILKMVAADAP